MPLPFGRPQLLGAGLRLPAASGQRQEGHRWGFRESAAASELRPLLWEVLVPRSHRHWRTAGP